MSGVVQAFSDLVPVAVGTAIVVSGGLTLYSVGKARGAKNSGKPQPPKRTNPLNRESEHVTVINQDQDGYGTAVRESDGGLDVLSFNGEDEVYQRVWVPGTALEDLANVVSVHAVEKERDDR